MLQNPQNFSQEFHGFEMNLREIHENIFISAKYFLSLIKL